MRKKVKSVSLFFLVFLLVMQMSLAGFTAESSLIGKEILGFSAPIETPFGDVSEDVSETEKTNISTTVPPNNDDLPSVTPETGELNTNTPKEGGSVTETPEIDDSTTENSKEGETSTKVLEEGDVTTQAPEEEVSIEENAEKDIDNI